MTSDDYRYRVPYPGNEPVSVEPTESVELRDEAREFTPVPPSVQVIATFPTEEGTQPLVVEVRWDLGTTEPSVDDLLRVVQELIKLDPDSVTVDTATPQDDAS